MPNASFSLLQSSAVFGPACPIWVQIPKTTCV